MDFRPLSWSTGGTVCAVSSGHQKFQYWVSGIHNVLINVARVQPGTSEGITDLLLPHPSSGLTH